MDKRSYKHELLTRMPHRVLRVLIRRKALHLWCKNALLVDVNLFESIAYNLSARGNPLIWLNNVFFWNATPEGYRFWEGIFNETLAEYNKR